MVFANGARRRVKSKEGDNDNLGEHGEHEPGHAHLAAVLTVRGHTGKVHEGYKEHDHGRGCEQEVDDVEGKLRLVHGVVVGVAVAVDECNGESQDDGVGQGASEE